MENPKLILASSSIYRKNLLSKLNLTFLSAAPDIDEQPLDFEKPEQTALRLGEAKARALQKKFPDNLIIGSDQVAIINKVHLTKPGNRTNAIKQLQSASSQYVTFYTSVSVLNSCTNQAISDLDICNVYFKTLSLNTIERYIDLEQPFDCAGSFKSEGLGIALFEKIEGGDPNALIGLPLIKLIGILEQLGINII